MQPEKGTLDYAVRLLVDAIAERVVERMAAQRPELLTAKEDYRACIGALRDLVARLH
jgi:hypothetical protein